MPLDPDLTVKKGNFEGMVRLSKLKSLTEVRSVIDRCRLVSQSNYLNNSNKECDWLILARFTE